MNDFTRPAALTAFLMMGLAFTKPSNAQTDTLSNVTRSNVALMQNKFDMGGHDLSAVNDSAFLLKQDTAGATVTSRALGFITRKKRWGDTAYNSDSTMFYRTRSEINGYTVDGQYALMHDHKHVYPNYEQADKTYAAWNIASPDGQVTSFILNRKTPEMIDGRIVGKFLTTIIQPNGKQYLIYLDEDMVDNVLVPAMGKAPEKALAFADKVCVKKNKSELYNPRPGYAGQELPGGRFQIISIDGSGFSSILGAGLTGSEVAKERKATVSPE